MNLVSNAIKFTETGKVAIHISSTTKSDREAVLNLQVSDTGIGIAESKLQSIFERFYRISPSNQNLYTGSGLGLFTVKQFVDSLDGDIEVESELGKGSKFLLSLPCKLPLQPRDTSPLIEISESFTADSLVIPTKQIANRNAAFNVRPKETDTALLKPCRALIIEDDKLCALVEKGIFNRLVADLKLVENVEAAKLALSKTKYDIVISDIGLPDGTGIDIIRWAKSSPDSKNMNTPFIALTAHNDAKTQKEASESGFIHFITKPISSDKAKSVLEVYVDADKSSSSNINEKMTDKLPIIDIALGKKRLSAQSSSDSTLEILGKLIELMPSDLEALSASTDFDESMNIMNKIKGSLYYCGAPRLEDCVNTAYLTLETANNADKKNELLKSIREEFKLLEREYLKIKS